MTHLHDVRDRLETYTHFKWEVTSDDDVKLASDTPPAFPSTIRIVEEDIWVAMTDTIETRADTPCQAYHDVIQAHGTQLKSRWSEVKEHLDHLGDPVSFKRSWVDFMNEHTDVTWHAQGTPKHIQASSGPIHYELVCEDGTWVLSVYLLGQSLSDAPLYRKQNAPPIDLFDVARSELRALNNHLRRAL